MKIHTDSVDFSYYSKKGVCDMNFVELTYAVTAIANAIACALSPSEIALVAGVFVQLGDTLATLAAGLALREEEKQNNKADGVSQ